MYADLLEQAEFLANRDKKRPKQANLRRAVSAAYYALFHYLTVEACRAIMGTHNEQRGYRHALARGFEHGSMKNACDRFKDGALPESLLRALPSDVVQQPKQKQDKPMLIVPAEISDIAATFVETQQKRHRADYDYSDTFFRRDVVALIAEVRAVTGGFSALPDSDVRRFFLVCLMAWKTLGSRSA